MSRTNKLSKSQKLLSIISASLLGGFMWHMRGQGGLASIWGLLAFGSVMTLFIFFYYGNREKMKYEFIPLGALMAALTVYKNGAVINMAGGTLISDAVFTGEEQMRMTPMSQVRGIIIMCLAGFALVCLFSIFIGTLFSKREYKLHHYLVYIATFFAVAFGSKASISHIIVRKLLPQVATGFEEGLADRGITGLSAMQAYLRNFNDIRFANDIPYGYPYYETIEHISFAIAAAVLILVALIIFRDKITALVSLGINLFGAVAFTVPDYFIVCRFETSFLSKINIPDCLRITSWSLWEYGVGLILGFGIALILALLPRELSAGRKYRSEALIKNKAYRFIYCFIMFGLVYAVVPARALAFRIADTLEFTGKMQDAGTVETVGMIVLSVIACLFYLVIIKINILDKSMPVPFRMKPDRFAGKMLTAYTPFLMLMTIFTGDNETIYHLMYCIRNYGKDVHNLLINCGLITPVIMIGSLIIFEIIFCIRLNQKSSAKE